MINMKINVIKLREKTMEETFLKSCAKASTVIIIGHGVFGVMARPFLGKYPVLLSDKDPKKSCLETWQEYVSLHSALLLIPSSFLVTNWICGKIGLN